MPLNLRLSYLAAAVQNAKDAGEPVTVETLKPYLPSDFDLIEADLIEAVPVIGEIEPAAFDADFCEPPAPAAPKMAPRPSAAAAEDANCALIAAHEALASARVTVQVCQRREAEANATLAKAIGQFQSGFQPYTPADLIRDHIKSEQAQRALAAAGAIPAPENAPTLSRIDAQRRWMRGGGPDSGQGNSGHATVDGRRVYPPHMRGHRVPVGRPKV